MDLHLYLNKQTRQLVNGPQSNQPFVFPPLYQGDDVNFVLHGQVPNPDASSLSPFVEDPISFLTIKCGLGFGPDYPPPSGTFKVRLTGTTETTPALPFNVAQADFLAALNALASVHALSAPGVALEGVTPTAVNFFQIRWVDAAITTTFEVVEVRLTPKVFVRSFVYAEDAGQLQIIKLEVAPLAFTDQFAYPALQPAFVASVRVGSGTQNCVQSLTVPKKAVGSLSLAFASNATAILTVAALNGTADASATLAAALNGIYSDGLVRFAVTRSVVGVYAVEFVGLLAKTDFPLLVVTMLNQVPANTPTAALSLDGPSLEIALHTQPSIALVFELEIRDSDGVTTPVQMAVTVVNDMIDAAMSIVADPDWLEQTNPSYQPYDPAGTSIVAPGAYITPLGSGIGVGTSGKSFVVNHNLGTLDCIVEVREVNDSHHRLPDGTYVTTYLNVDQIQIDFATAPTDGQYRVIISAVVPALLALPPHHHPISDIDGLQTILDELLGGINPNAPISENELPTHIPWYNRDTAGNQTTLKFDPLPDALLPDDVLRSPLTGDELPDGTPYYSPGPPPGIYVTLPGPPPTTIQLFEIDSDGTLHLVPTVFPTDLSTIPGFVDAIVKALQSGAPIPAGYIPITLNPIAALSYPPMALLRPGEPTVVPTLPRALPAFTAGGSVTNALPLPGAGLAGTVFTVSGGASAVAVRSRSPQFFADGVKIGCDGSQFYPVGIVGADAFPREMEQELFTVHVSPNMLAPGTRFLVQAQLTLGLTGPAALATRAAYTLLVQFGHTNGPFLSSVMWDSAALQETLIVGDAATTHSFGVNVTRQSRLGGALIASANLYARENPVTPPPSNNFVVRASLTQFDLEDVTPVQGQVQLSFKGTASVANL